MKISVKNFQSLESAEVEAEGLTVIVGRSNLGKSALIRAVTGALFNRPGAGFVRKGESKTRVELTDVPAKDGPPLHVVWEKGKSVNEFSVNGEPFTNVNRYAPQPLVDAGYRDLKLDDKESIRPQVGGQLDPIFMLQLPGSTVSEILTRASRLDILLRASAACAKDLRSARQLLGLRRADLTKAQAIVETIEPPVAKLVEAVERLKLESVRVDALRDRVSRLTAALARRRMLQAAVAADLPTAVDLGPIEAQANIGQRLANLIPKRAALQKGVMVELPPAREPSGIEVLQERHWRVADLAARLRKLWVVKGLHPPPESPQLGYSKAMDTATALRALVNQLANALASLRMAEAAFGASSQDVEQAEGAVATALHDLKICPVCGQRVPLGQGQIDEDLEALLG